LLSSEPLLLFLVIGIGYIVGQIKIKGIGLGISGVLFIGLLFGAWRPDDGAPFAISHSIIEVGLILFVYAVGLTSGPGFFTAMRRNGLRFNAAMIVALVAGALTTVMLGRLLELDRSFIA